MTDWFTFERVMIILLSIGYLWQSDKLSNVERRLKASQEYLDNIIKYLRRDHDFDATREKVL